MPIWREIRNEKQQEAAKVVAQVAATTAQGPQIEYIEPCPTCRGVTSIKHNNVMGGDIKPLCGACQAKAYARYEALCCVISHKMLKREEEMVEHRADLTEADIKEIKAAFDKFLICNCNACRPAQG